MRLDTAQMYTDAGISLIPVKTDGSKAPDAAVSPTWTPYQRTRASRQDRSRWYGPGEPDRGFGLVHGRVSGNLETIDCDTAGAYEELCEMIRDHGRSDLLDRLLRVKTPQGHHLTYRCAEPVEGNLKLAYYVDHRPEGTARARLYHTASGDVCGVRKAKIETRGEGGYTIAPGSPRACHPTGKPYRLMSGKYKDLPVLTAEERNFLLAMGRACNEVVEEPQFHRVDKSEGHTDSGLLRPGDDFNRRGGEQALELLKARGWVVVRHREGSLQLRRPDKSEGVSATYGYVAPDVLYVFSTSAAPFESERAYTPFAIFALLECGGDFAEAARRLGAQGYGEQRRSLLTPDASATPAIAGDTRAPVFDSPPASLSVELLPVPPLDLELVPTPLRPWLADIAARGPFPVEYGAAAALVALSAIVGRQVGIRPKRHDDWTVIPNLWGAIVGPPGVQKTPATAEALKPLHRLEKESREAFVEQAEEHAADQLVAKARADATKDALRKKAKSGATHEELQQLVREAADTGGEAEPVWHRYTTSDTSVEKLGELLAVNPNGLLLFRDELTGFLKTLERQGHETDRAFYLEAWNGSGSFTCDRIGRGTTVIEATCLSLFGTIQPGPLARYLRGAASGDEADGFAPRLQILVYPDPPRVFRNVDRWPNGEARTAAFSVFQRLANVDAHQIRAEREEGNPVPFLRFNGEAQARFDAWREALENRLLSGSDTPLMQMHLAKYRSLLPSLALLLHLAECPSGGPVPLLAIERAIVWCEFLEAHARRIYQCAMDGDVTSAHRLAERMRQSLPSPFTVRDVVRKQWSGLTSVEDVERAINFLEDRGWVKTQETGSGPGGGRPTTHVYINPNILINSRPGTDKTDKTSGETLGETIPVAPAEDNDAPEEI